MTDDQTDTSLLSRRRLLRAMGVSTAGVAAAGAIAASREKIVDAGDTAKEELAELKKQFDALEADSSTYFGAEWSGSLLSDLALNGSLFSSASN